MFARVKEDCRLPAVRACGGVMFVKGEWVEVPSEHTLDALTHEMLEIKPIDEQIAADVPDDVNPPDDESEIKPIDEQIDEPIDEPISAEVVTEVAPMPEPPPMFEVGGKGSKKGGKK